MKTLALGFALLVLAGCAATPATRGTVLVVGASSGTGLEIVKVLAARGDDVTAFVRPTSNRTELDALHVKYAVGDATDAASVRQALSGHKVRAIVSTLGGRRGEPQRPDLIGTKNLAEAAKAAGVKRMVMITVIGAGDSKNALPERVQQSLGPIVPLKTQTEAALQASGVPYTIVRPGGLTTNPATGKGALTLDHTAFSSISRAELARLTVQALDDPKAANQIYHAIDPTNGGRN